MGGDFAAVVKCQTVLVSIFLIGCGGSNSTGTADLSAEVDLAAAQPSDLSSSPSDLSSTTDLASPADLGPPDLYDRDAACAQADFTSDNNNCGTCGAACAAGYNCESSVCVPTDCYALHLQSPSSPSGLYSIDPDGHGGYAAFTAYCDMSSSGGGWTLLMKIDGTKTTFSYAASYWSNDTAYNALHPDLDGTEAKLQGFANLPFTAMRIGMNDSGTTRWLEVSQTATSLQSQFQPGSYVATSAGRRAWERLVGSPSLQPNCNREGFNNVGSSGNGADGVRLGILGNNENDCATTDSRLGLGGAGNSCSGDSNNSCGNVAEAGICSDNGARDTMTFGYLLVRGCPNGACACGNLTHCGSLCVDLATDPNHCGACSASCSVGATCSAHACQCPNGTSLCNAVDCVNFNTDGTNCGGCGTVCAGGQSCSSGKCCPNGQVSCSNVCSTVSNDASNCGSCGIICSTGQSCLSGVCCNSGLSNCSNSCVNKLNDPHNCGSCGVHCPTTCTSGQCDCPSGKSACTLFGAIACVNTQTDPSNCGYCGHYCGSGQCSGGSCVGCSGSGEGSGSGSGECSGSGSSSGS